MTNQIMASSLLQNGGPTDLTPGEVKTICTYVMHNERRNPNAKYLEIGVFAGATIRFLKQHTKTTTFYGVDLFEDFALSNDNTHTSGTFRRDDVQNAVGDRCHLIKGNSDDVLPTLTEKFDHIFIDGNHTYEATCKDFNNCTRLLAPGGQISFHNSSTHWGPDFELYNHADGGPWLVTQELIVSKEWNLIEVVDRVKVFSKV